MHRFGRPRFSHFDVHLAVNRNPLYNLAVAIDED